MIPAVLYSCHFIGAIVWIIACATQIKLSSEGVRGVKQQTQRRFIKKAKIKTTTKINSQQRENHKNNHCVPGSVDYYCELANDDLILVSTVLP